MNELGKFLSSFFLVVGLHISFFLAGGLIASISSSMGMYTTSSALLFAALGIGIVQLIYIIPLSVWLSRKREWGFMKGVIIGAVITALLNGGYWLLVSIRID